MNEAKVNKDSQAGGEPVDNYNSKVLEIVQNYTAIRTLIRNKVPVEDGNFGYIVLVKIYL